MRVKSNAINSPEFVDPDDAPELTKEFFEHAIPMIGNRVVSKNEYLAAVRAALKQARSHKHRAASR